jgi:hypothetical protein
MKEGEKMEKKKESMQPMVQKDVSDLGAGAYLLMLGYKVIGRKGKSIIFEVEETGSREFEQNTLEYLSSDFHRFDSCLMSLKKINEYMPDR